MDTAARVPSCEGYAASEPGEVCILDDTEGRFGAGLGLEFADSSRAGGGAIPENTLTRKRRGSI